jgi:hypothetical protein
MSDGRFIEIVPPAEPEIAARVFRDRLAELGLSEEDIDPEDVRVDTIRGLDGRTLRRYWILHSYLPPEDQT